MGAEYVELRCRSAFSFLDGASSPEDLIAAAADGGAEALALADADGVYGAPRFFAAARAAGVRPIVGADVTLAGAPPLLLLCESRARLPEPVPPADRGARRAGQTRSAARDAGAARRARGRADRARRRRAARRSAGDRGGVRARQRLPRDPAPRRRRRRLERTRRDRAGGRGRRRRRRHQRRPLRDAAAAHRARRAHLRARQADRRRHRPPAGAQRRALAEAAARDGGAVPRSPGRRARDAGHRGALRVLARRSRLHVPALSRSPTAAASRATWKRWPGAASATATTPAIRSCPRCAAS